MSGLTVVLDMTQLASRLFPPLGSHCCGLWPSSSADEVGGFVLSPARARLPAWTGERAQLLAGASAQSSGARWGRGGKLDSALAKLVWLQRQILQK